MPPAARLTSLDHFRGYAVLGMFAVNFLGRLDVTPPVLRHTHTFCSYADTVMPAFVLAVGVALRLTFVKRRRTLGTWAALRHAAGRGVGLMVLGVLVYGLTGKYAAWAELAAVPAVELPLKLVKRGPFEALTHIGATILWVLPVLAAPGWVRLVYLLLSAGLHVAVSRAGYYEWNLTAPVGIDGGPLGFLTWAVPLLAGTLAHDGLADGEPVYRVVLFGLLLMLAGGQTWWQWGLGGPPFVGSPGGPVNYWTMSQRAGSVTYLFFAGGLALVALAGFVWACDRCGLRVGFLELFGRQALAGYLIHLLALRAVEPLVPRDSPAWYVGLAFAAFLGLVTVCVRHLDRQGVALRV